MKNTTDKLRAVGSSRLALLWRKIFPPKPEAPCTICGELTTESNMFDPTFFYHKTCMRRKDEMEKAEAEKREKIEIVKTAMRELAAEKQNDELCRESASRSPVTS